MYVCECVVAMVKRRERWRGGRVNCMEGGGTGKFTETKFDSSFPNSQFAIDGFSVPFRCDRNRFGGGVLIYVRDDIPSMQVTKHKLPGDIEGIFVEINLRKTKWLIFGTYRPLN